MADFAEKVGIGQIIKDAGHEPSENFEHIYSQIYSAKNEDALRKLDLAIRNYFEQLALPDVPTLYDYLVLSLMTCH